MGVHKSDEYIASAISGSVRSTGIGIVRSTPVQEMVFPNRSAETAVLSARETLCAPASSSMLLTSAGARQAFSSDSTLIKCLRSRDARGREGFSARARGDVPFYLDLKVVGDQMTGDARRGGDSPRMKLSVKRVKEG